MGFSNLVIAVPANALQRSHVPSIPRKRFLLSRCSMLERSGRVGECPDFPTIRISILCIPNPMRGSVRTGICDIPLGGLLLPCYQFGDWRVCGRFPRYRCPSSGVQRGQTCAA